MCVGRLAHLEQDLAEDAAGETFEGLGELIEVEDGVDLGMPPGGGEQADDLGPCGAGLGGGVGADGDAADADASEEEAGGVEIGDGSCEASDDGDAAVLVEGVEEGIEEGSGDVVDDEVDGASAEGGIELGSPFGVVGGEGELGAFVEEGGVLGGVAGEGDGGEAHGGGELECSEADAAGGPGDEDDGSGPEVAPLGECLVSGEVDEGRAGGVGFGPAAGELSEDTDGHGDLFGEGSGSGDAGIAAEDDAGVAGGEADDAGTDVEDVSDAVASEDVGEGGLSGVEAFGEVAVGGVEGGVVDGDDDFAVCCGGSRQFTEAKTAEAVELVDEPGAHGFLWSGLG